jgi:hypothetical protein
VRSFPGALEKTWDREASLKLPDDVIVLREV